MIVGEEIERHRGDFCQQFIERRRIGGGRNVVAVAGPHRCLVVLRGRHREDHRLRHIRSAACRAKPRAFATSIMFWDWKAAWTN